MIAYVHQIIQNTPMTIKRTLALILNERIMSNQASGENMYQTAEMELGRIRLQGWSRDKPNCRGEVETDQVWTKRMMLTLPPRVQYRCLKGREVC